MFAAIRFSTLFCIALFMLVLPLFAQQSLDLQLLSGTYRLNRVQTWEAVQQASPVYAGKRYVILQFDPLPTEAQKQAMQANGITLLGYLPHNAWFAEVEAQASMDREAYSIYAFSAIPVSAKMSPQMAENQFPAHAILPSGEWRVEVHCLPSAQMESLPVAVGSNLRPTAYRNVFTMNILPQHLTVLAAYPFVGFIAPVEPPRQPELTYRNTVGRANYLSSGINGMTFNGSGVTLAIEEGGFLDTTSIDFAGRRGEYTPLSQGVGGHKTGCAENAGSAGNYDPKFRANAWGAKILSLDGDTWGHYTTDTLRMASHSYGYGISGGYWASSADHDQQIRTQRSMMHFYSSGNEGSGTCNYGTYNGLAGWSNITGGMKQAKNVMAICNTSPYDDLSFGSVGPAYDGRIKPDVCIEGWEGTSYASPKAAGMMAQLYQAYKSTHGGADPNSGLIKALMLNTADEMFTPGPDFKTGFGRINLRRAYNVMTANQFIADSLTHGQTKIHVIAVPANIKEVRVLTYWNDYQATVNAATALVNNLNTSLLAPGGTNYLPWVLNTFPHADSLDNPAKRGGDNLNNVEQITLPNPAAGSYSLLVSGMNIPQGPQRYFVVYEFLMDEITLTYPIGNEHFVAGESEIIRWDNYGDATNPISLDFSADSGATWTSIATGLAATSTNYTWTVPNVVTGKGIVRVTRAGLQRQSLRTFHIAPVVQNIGTIWACGDSLMLGWDAVPGATGYRITRLGAKYMDSVGVSTTTHFKVYNANLVKGEWFSVQAYCANGALGRRALAWHWTPGNTACVPVDATLKKAFPYESGYYPTCYTSIKRPLRLLVQNAGTQSLANAVLKFQVNSGPIFTSNFTGTLLSADAALVQTTDSLSFVTAGNYTLKIWLQVAGDGNALNDTLKQQIIVYAATGQTPQYTQNFDAFTTCSTSWGCETVTCGLSSGWFNVPNTPTVHGDSIDWRTHTGATGTGSTGPDFDHTTGTGKYLYLETSSTDGSGCQNKAADLHSTCMDLRNTHQPMLDYWYHAYGSSIGSLQVDVLGDSGWTNAVLPPVIGDQGNLWKNSVAPLQAFENQVVVVRFAGKTGGGYTGDLAIDDIKVTTLPKAAFQPSVTLLCAGGAVSTLNTSAYSTSYAWSVTPSAGVSYTSGNAASPQPTLSFAQAGTYTLRLIATNAIGTDTLIQTVSVATAPTQTSLSTVDPTLCVGDSLSITATATSPLPLSYVWKRNNNPLGISSATVSLPAVTQANAGTYVCEITNQCGTVTASQLIMVSALPVVSLGAALTLASTDSLTLTPGAGFSSYVWNGNPAQNQPAYTFHAGQYGVGTFAVAVTVTNAAGCANSDTVSITVVPAAQAGFQAAAGLCLGDTLVVQNTSLDAASYLWEVAPTGSAAFINGTSATSAQPSLSFTQPGAYTLKLTASNAYSTDSTSQPLTVHALPVVSLGKDTTILSNAALLLDAGAGFAAYAWNGDPTQNQPTYPFSGAQSGVGSFPVTVSFTDANGCSGADTVTITVELYNATDPVLLQSVTLLPNPNSGLCWLSLAAGTSLPQRLALHDLHGKQLWEAATAQASFPYALDFSTLPAAVYLLQVQWETGNATLKVEVMR